MARQQSGPFMFRGSDQAISGSAGACRCFIRFSGRRHTIGVFGAVIHQARFFEPRFDDTVVNDGRIPPRAHTEAQIVLVDQHTHFAGEFRRSIGDDLDVFQALILSPFVHHEAVVDRHAIDFVDPPGGEIGITIFKTGQLVGRAGRGERPRQGEQDYALVGEIVGCRLVFPTKGIGSVD